MLRNVRGWTLFVALMLAALTMVACSSSGDGSTGRGVIGGADGDGAGDGDANGGGGGTGAIPGGGTGGIGSAPPGGSPPPGGQPPPGPVIDPNAVPFTEDNRSGVLDPGVVSQLEGATSCSAPLIYPYEGTVFPGGLPAPKLMWRGNTSAAYAWFRYDNVDTVDYKFAVGNSNPGEIQIPQDAWNEITRRTRSTGLRITVAAMVDGSPSKCETVLQIAPGNLVGSIYYNTYNAPGNIGNGAVMRLQLGQNNADIYLQYQGFAVPATGPCISCHSVSADGSTIVASTHDYLTKVFDVFSYDLGQAANPPRRGTVENANFGGLTPDGSHMLAMGNPACTAGAESFPRNTLNFPLVEGPDHARLVDTTTGQEIPTQGLNPDYYMWMPQFSPNGDKVVFNHAKPDGMGGTDRRELATMDYDPATNTFSNLRVIASRLGPNPSMSYSPGPALGGPIPTGMDGCTTTDPNDPLGLGTLPMGTCTGPCYPAYPFFTPDGNAVIFQLTSEPDFSSAFPGRNVPAKSELWYVDLRAQNPTPIPLDNINNTMDQGMAQQDYYPTVLPVAVGGYFWVFWTSRRAHGHEDVNLNPVDPEGKRIWAAAITPSGGGGEVSQTDDPTVDPSHPGFYVQGQSDSGNVRAFAALNPCMASGSVCTAGLDCCTGFCYIEDGASAGTCTEEIPECSKTNERCDTDADCCPPDAPDEPQNICLGGFCSFVVVK